MPLCRSRIKQIVSGYFDKGDGIALSAYNGTSQLGDFIALITFYIVRRLLKLSEGVCFLFSSLYLVIFVIIIQKVIDSCGIQKKGKEIRPQKEHYQLNQEHPPSLEPVENIAQNSEPKQQGNNPEGPTLDRQVSGPSPVIQEKTVTMFSVWLLPGVALNVLAYGFIKAVNAFIMGWLVFYLMRLQLGSDAVFMTILWSASVFVGGLISATTNKKYNKTHFIFQLLIAAVCFLFLEQMHNKIYENRIIIFIILCGLFYGGPYNLMSTAIPLILGSQKQILEYSNGKGMIIALMQGYGQFFCAISLLLVPVFSISNIHAAGSIYCGIAMILLSVETIRQKKTSKVTIQ